MHIPDGYLGPQTYIPAAGVMVPLWAIASQRVRKSLRVSRLPQLALGAAFSFVVMMFNIPIPGGTSGHAVGAVLVAILLGPWAAVIAVSTALVVQALLFGDGGITALGANCLNMAVIMPFVGWWTYKLVTGGASCGPKRRIFGALAGGYVGVNAGALSAALMFGIQPLIAHDAAGRPLYSPFGLNVAVPAMMAGHLFLVGLFEALATGLVVAYMQRVDPAQFPASAPIPAAKPARPIHVRVLPWLGLLVALTPLGLYLPAKFAAGSAWGEWSADELVKVSGFVPRGLESMQSLWHAPLPDYGLPGRDGSLTYLLSAFIGVLVIFGMLLGARALLTRKEAANQPTALDGSADVR